MTFKTWCLKNEYKFINTPEGDFISDVKIDKRFPACKNQNKLYDYLHERKACREAFDAFQKLYSAYIEFTLSDVGPRVPFSSRHV